MLLEQEMASIIKYALDNSGNPAPYYYEVPEGFVVPAAYFPVPEITTRGDTLLTYAAEFVWFIKFFHSTTQEAQALAFEVLSALQANRNIIPLIDTSGNYTGETFRVKDPEIKTADDGAVQLTISWDSRRPYNNDSADAPTANKINVRIALKKYENAVEKFSAALS